MRVDDRNLAGPAASGSEKALESARVDREGATNGIPSRSGSASDRVELSGLAGRIAQTLEALETDRSSRIEHLAVEYRSGRYTVDSHELARTMIAMSLERDRAA